MAEETDRRAATSAGSDSGDASEWLPNPSRQDDSNPPARSRSRGSSSGESNSAASNPKPADSKSKATGSKPKRTGPKSKSTRSQSKSTGSKPRPVASRNKAKGGAAGSAKTGAKPEGRAPRKATNGGPDGPRSEKSKPKANGANGGDGEYHPTAPSLGPNTVIEREPVEERLARHEQSPVDAMGEDKRRPVVGKTYGPTKARQLVLYGIFLAVVVALAIGGKLLVDSLDTPVGKNIPNSAPWAQPNAKQHPPKPLQ